MGNGAVNLSTTCSYRGAASVEVSLPARSTGGQVEAQLVTNNGSVPTPPTTWYTRGYFYLPAPLQPYSTGLLKVQQSSPPFHGAHLRVAATGLLEVLNDRDTPSLTVSAVAFPLDRWVCVELEVGIGSPAPIRARIDGTLALDYAQSTVATPAFTRFVAGQIPTVASAASSAWTYYVDDLVVSASPVGCAD